ncbi:hypothetical protein PCK2_000086 [Pneumocystis canis]|nr:hypothetical protein PCK2_000086 [Pneumocystis canis]
MAAHDTKQYTDISSEMPLDHVDQAEYLSDLNFTEDSMHSHRFSNHLSQSSLTLHRSASWHRLSPSQSETSQIFSDNNQTNSSRACLIEGVHADDMYNFDIKDVIQPIPIVSSNVHSLSAAESYSHHNDNKRHSETPMPHVSSDLPGSSVSATSKKCKYSGILYTSDQPPETYQHLTRYDDNTSIESCEDSHIDSIDAKSEKVEEDVCFPMTEEPTGIVFGVALLDCEDLLEEYHLWKRVAINLSQVKSSDPFSRNRKLFKRQGSCPEGAVHCVYAHPGWIPLGKDFEGNNIGVDLAPGPTGRWGQVILFGRDQDIKYVVAQSWASFLSMLADDFEKGDWTVDDTTGELFLGTSEKDQMSYFDILKSRINQRRKGLSGSMLSLITPNKISVTFNETPTIINTSDTTFIKTPQNKDTKMKETVDMSPASKGTTLI